MKIKGKDFSSLAKPRTIAIPVEGGEPLTLLYAPVLNFSEFENKYPEPKPEIKVKVDSSGKKEEIIDQESYDEQMDKWSIQRTHWMIWKSLSCNEGIEWEGVDLSDPETFLSVKEELSEDFGAGFVNVLINKIIDASNMRSDLIDIATKDFLAMGAVGAGN